MLPFLAAARELLAIACGGGCPIALSWLPSKGSTVIDLGCGGGHDVVLAGMLVQGKPGARAIGVDMSPAMLERTEAVAAKAGLADVVSTTLAQIDAPQGESDPLPQKELQPLAGAADLVISNGVFNLFTDKLAGFRTAFKLCEPAGRFHLTDVVVDTSGARAPSAAAA